MAKVEMTRQYDVERSELFTFITQPQSWPRWYNNCIAVDESNGWAEVGDEAELTIRLLGRDVAVHMELDEYTVDTHTKIHTTAKGLPEVVQSWDLADGANGSTEVTVTLETSEATSFFDKVIDRFLLPKTIERDLARSLDNLEDLVGIEI